MGAGVATPEGTGTEQNGGCQLDEDEGHGATENAKALPTDEELALGGATLQVGQGLDGLYRIGSHELDATFGKVSGHEVANEDGVEVDTFFGKALKAGDVDCTKTVQGDVTGETKKLDDGSKVAVSDDDDTSKVASLVQ